MPALGAAVIWAALLVVAIVALATAVLLSAAFLIADRLTRTRRRRVRGTPDDEGLRYEEIQFLSAGDLILRGWFVASPGAKATVILVHGEGENRASSGLRDLLTDYVARGFNAFEFDLRGHGESAGSRASLGELEVRDVEAAIACVRRHAGATPIVLHGFGTGATYAIVAAERSREVRAVIADTPVGSIRQHLIQRASPVTRWLLPLSLRMANRWFDADVNALAPHHAIRDLDVPVLLIHGVRDPLVPAAHSINLAAASLHHATQLWRVEAPRDHAGAYGSDPEGYMRRCVAHIDAAMPGTIAASVAG
jgi:alpha-beta hydrolase superfamily lysophospholipase